MSDPSLDGYLLTLVQEIRSLEHRLRILGLEDSPNSRTLQAEVEARITENQQRLASLRPLKPIPDTVDRVARES